MPPKCPLEPERLVMGVVQGVAAATAAVGLAAGLAMRATGQRSDARHSCGSSRTSGGSLLPPSSASGFHQLGCSFRDGALLCVLFEERLVSVSGDRAGLSLSEYQYTGEALLHHLAKEIQSLPPCMQEAAPCQACTCEKLFPPLLSCCSHACPLLIAESDFPPSGLFVVRRIHKKATIRLVPLA
jgi:hypothetical protein